MNRRCFLQQVKKVFHSTPFFKVVTALDYHQMLCLICSDFPRSLMIEAVRTLPLAPEDAAPGSASSPPLPPPKTGDALLFQKFDLAALQRTIAVFFFFNEFMEAVRAIFLELQGPGGESLDIHARHAVTELFTLLRNFLQRPRPAPVPPVEVLLEILLGERCQELAEREVLLLPEEARAALQGKVCYLEFAQDVAKNPKILRAVYEPAAPKRQLQDTLKDMASDLDLHHAHGKKPKGKKKKL